MQPETMASAICTLHNLCDLTAEQVWSVVAKAQLLAAQSSGGGGGGGSDGSNFGSNGSGQRDNGSGHGSNHDTLHGTFFEVRRLLELSWASCTLLVLGYERTWWFAPGLLAGGKS